MDERLLKEAQRGNDEAFFQLMSIHKEQLYRTAFSYLKNEEDALEALQEVTFRAYKNIRKVREPKYFTTWLVGIMMNYCIDELKRHKRLSLNPDIGVQSSIHNDYDRSLIVEEAISQLDPKLQEIVLLKYFQGLTIEQIADNLGSPTGTVKSWLNRALVRLRKQFEKEDGKHVSGR